MRAAFTLVPKVDRLFKLFLDTDYASQSRFNHRPVYPYRLQLYAESKFENKFIVVEGKRETEREREREIERDKEKKNHKTKPKILSTEQVRG